MKIVLIGCTARKKNYKCPAKELYSASAFFSKEYEYAKEIQKADKVYILSAKHHLVHEDTVLEPYNQTLVGAPIGVKKAWAKKVLEQIKREFNPVTDELVFMCGKNYYGFLENDLKAAGFKYSIPMKDVGGIGKQLHWLDDQLK